MTWVWRDAIGAADCRGEPPKPAGDCALEPLRPAYRPSVDDGNSRTMIQRRETTHGVIAHADRPGSTKRES